MKDIIILTHDLQRNQTFVYRYISFIKALKAYGKNAKGIGFDYPYKPHPINELQNLPKLKVNGDLSTLKVVHLNWIQKLLVLCDSSGLPFSIKKYLLALHVIIFKIDQWFVIEKNLKQLEIQPQIIISGGAGGIIKTSAILAKKYNTKLILDYRDPWNFGYNLLETNDFVHQFKKFFMMDNELRFLQRADKVIVVSESLKKSFPDEFHHKITVIENGSNYEEIKILDLINQHPVNFNIVYSGSIYNDQIEDETFFKAFSKFKESLESTDRISLKFIGSERSGKLKKILEKYGLLDITEITPRLDPDKILPYLLNASMFLHLRYGNRSKIITSKNSDYLLFRKPILLPVSDKGDLEESILKNNSGYVCNDETEIIEVLNKEYQKYTRKENIIINKAADFSYLTRIKLAEKFADIVTEVADKA